MAAKADKHKSEASFFLANQHEDDFDRMLREQILAESYDSLVLDVALTSQQHPGYAPQMRKLKSDLPDSDSVVFENPLFRSDSQKSKSLPTPKSIGPPQSVSGTSASTAVITPKQASTNAPTTAPIPTKAASAPTPATAPTGPTENSDVKKRLEVKVDTSHLVSALESKEANHGTKMFEATHEEHSKIYKALNPDKLWYESRREKDEANDVDEEDDGEIVMRDGEDFGMRIQDESGNIIHEEVEHEVVPYELPTFDPETEAELKKLRKEREIALIARQAALKEKYLKKKAEEEALRKKEVERILEEDARKKKGEEVTAEMVKDAQKRMDSTFANSQFAWKA